MPGEMELSSRLEAQKTLADAILLERALVVLRRLSRRGWPGGGYSAGHWVSVKSTLGNVASAMRDEAESYDGIG